MLLIISYSLTTSKFPFSQLFTSNPYVPQFPHFLFSLYSKPHFPTNKRKPDHAYYAAQGGGSLHRAPDLSLIMADAGTKPQAPRTLIQKLCLTQPQEENEYDVVHQSPPTENRADGITLHIDCDWLDPLLANEATRTIPHKDVSQDP